MNMNMNMNRIESNQQSNIKARANTVKQRTQFYILYSKVSTDRDFQI
jgi:hypothetical protein